MVAPPLANVSPAAVRVAAVRAVALGLDRRRADRLVFRAGVEAEGAGPVQPIASLPADELGSAIAGAVARSARRPGRRLLTPDTLPAGLDPALDHALAALDARSRLALVLRHWADWDPPRIASVLGVGVAEVRAMVAAASEALDAPLDEVARHLARRAASVAVSPRRRRARRPASAVPLVAAAALVVLLVVFAGAASAPLPTVAGPEQEELSLVDAPLPALPELPPGELELREAAAGAALEWHAAALPAGVAFRWVVPAAEGFVALGVAPEEATAPFVHPAGFWTSPDGLDWTQVAADRSAMGPAHVVSGIAAAEAGVVAVGGEEHPGTPGALVRPAAWRLEDGAPRWERAGLRTAPVGSPVSVRWVYEDLSVVAAGADVVAYARAELALTGRGLPEGFSYAVDELGITLLGPAGAPVERLGFAQLGLGERAAARLAAGEGRGVAWRSADGLRWETVPLGAEPVLEEPAYAMGRLWATAGTAAFSSVDGAHWGRIELGAEADIALRSVAGYPGGLAIAGGSLSLVVADSADWFRVALPPTDSALTGARWAAGGDLGLVAYGTMGSDTGEVVVPQVTVPGDGGRLEVDLFTGALAVVGDDGEVRHRGGYYSGGNFRVDFAAGTFSVVDAYGDQRLSGSLESWADAVAAAFRTPYPPDGQIGVWYSPDGEVWSLQDESHGFAGTGFPAAVAVGSDRVVVAAARPPRGGQPANPQLWVGAPPP